jgi:hypothetical protein
MLAAVAEPAHIMKTRFVAVHTGRAIAFDGWRGRTRVGQGSDVGVQRQTNERIDAWPSGRAPNNIVRMNAFFVPPDDSLEELVDRGPRSAGS